MPALAHERDRDRRSLGLRARILSVIGVAILAVVGGVLVTAVRVSGLQADIQSMADLQRLSADVKELRVANSDISGWQVGYAWQTRTGAPAEAIKADSPFRAGFTAARDALDKHLAQLPTQAMTPQERELFTTVRATYQEFFAGDDQVVKLYAAGKLAEGDALINGGSVMASYTKIFETTDALLTSVQRRTQSTAVDAASASRATMIWIAAGAGGAVVVLVGLGLWLSASAVRSLGPVRETLDAMRRGDFTVPVQAVGHDEIAQMATSAEASRVAVRDLVSGVTAVVHDLTRTSEHVTTLSSEVATDAEEGSGRSASMADTAKTVGQSTSTVAAGAEEMTVSIREIAKSANDAAGVAARAVHVADQTNATVAKLGESSVEIGNVIKVITSIAEHTATCSATPSPFRGHSSIFPRPLRSWRR